MTKKIFSSLYFKFIDDEKKISRYLKNTKMTEMNEKYAMKKEYLCIEGCWKKNENF